MSKDGARERRGLGIESTLSGGRSKISAASSATPCDTPITRAARLYKRRSGPNPNQLRNHHWAPGSQRSAMRRLTITGTSGTSSVPIPDERFAVCIIDIAHRGRTRLR